MTRIAFEDKESTRSSSLPAKNQVKDADLNEIKTSVNALYDTVETLELDVDAKESSLPSMVGNSLKVLRVNAGETAKEWATISSGLTIGTTAITSGTNTRVLYQSGGVVSQSANLLFNGNGLSIGGYDASTSRSLYIVPVAQTFGIDVEQYVTNGYGGRFVSNNSGTATAILASAINGTTNNALHASQGNIHVENGAIGIGIGTPGAKLDVKCGGALSTDIALRVRNSVDTGNIIDARGNSTINFFPAVSNPVFNINSNVNPTVNFYDANGLGAIIAHRYQTNPANASNLMSQSINFASYGVSGGTNGGAKINHFINTYNWGNTYDAQKEGGYSLYFDSTNNFEGVVNSKKAFWISPDKRQFIYNKTGDVITAQTDAFCFYSDDQTAGNAAPHFRTENGDIIKLFKGAALTAADATLATAITRIAELEARLQASGLIA